jgi:hypothetical protein
VGGLKVGEEAFGCLPLEDMGDLVLFFLGASVFFFFFLKRRLMNNRINFSVRINDRCLSCSETEKPNSCGGYFNITSSHDSSASL